jgi:hypothetical protein
MPTSEKAPSSAPFLKYGIHKRVATSAREKEETVPKLLYACAPEVRTRNKRSARSSQEVVTPLATGSFEPALSS